MALRSPFSTRGLATVSSITTLRSVLEGLGLFDQATMQTFLAVINPPQNAAGVPLVIISAAEALREYRNSLKESDDGLKELVNRMAVLANACLQSLPSIDLVYAPTQRDMEKHPAWHMLMQLKESAYRTDLIEVCGAELALSMQISCPFDVRLARNFNTLLKSGQPLAGRQPFAFYAAIRRSYADRVFDRMVAGNAPQRNLTEAVAYGARVRSYLRVKIYFARNRQHQAIADFHASSKNQVIAGAIALREEIESGNRIALFKGAAALSGLPDEIAFWLPFIGHTDDLTIAIDLENGQMKIDASLFAQGGAKGKTASFQVTGEVIVIPWRAFIVDALRAAAAEAPTAGTLGALLLDVLPRGRDSITGARSTLIDTHVRFRNGLGPFAVELGISRFLASQVLVDPCLIPGGKCFYARAEREELWEAAGKLYDGLGWGPPCELEAGLASGSQVVATQQTVHDWFAWMVAEVERRRLKRRYSLESLVQFHNVYANFVGSMVVFLLGLRIRKHIQLDWSTLDTPGRISYALHDKRVGEFPGNRPVPACAVLTELFRHWKSHCAEMARRLLKLGVPATGLIVRAFTGRSPDASLFFSIGGKGRTVSIGVSKLADWWPSEFGLPGNFGRHFWQNMLRTEGLSDTDIDLFMRHVLTGMDALSSTSDVHQAARAREIVTAMNQVNTRLAITAVAGLSSRSTP